MDGGHASVHEVDHEVYIPCSFADLLVKCVCGMFVLKKKLKRGQDLCPLPLDLDLQLQY